MRLSDALGKATELCAQKNLSGRRFSRELSHTSVSEQETSRPLLTVGELLQLPANDALLLVSGLAPIRANKLKYNKYQNFLRRRLPAPALHADRYADTPPVRGHNWHDATISSPYPPIRGRCRRDRWSRPADQPQATTYGSARWAEVSDVKSKRCSAISALCLVSRRTLSAATMVPTRASPLKAARVQARANTSGAWASNADHQTNRCQGA
jgi:hypothetical protein